MEILDIAIIGATIVNVVLTLINTYWAYQRTCYNKQVLYGSRKYWNSWQKRSKDVVRNVLEDMTEKDLEKELERRKNAKSD